MRRQMPFFVLCMGSILLSGCSKSEDSSDDKVSVDTKAVTAGAKKTAEKPDSKTQERADKPAARAAMPKTAELGRPAADRVDRAPPQREYGEIPSQDRL